MLRKLLLSIVIAVVVLIIAAVVAVLVFDPNKYREEIAAHASDRLGREVRLGGPVELALFPWLAVDIHDVSIGTPADFPQAPPLARAGRARGSVRVLPLLRGRIEVGSVTVEGAEVSLVTAADSVSNIDGLFSDDDDGKEDEGKPDLTDLHTGNIRFDNLSLSLIDLVESSETQLSVARLDLGAFSAGEQVPLSFSASVLDDGRTVAELDLKGKLRVAPDLSEVGLSGLSLDYLLPEAGISGTADGRLAVNLSAQPVHMAIEAFNTHAQLYGLDAELATTQPVDVFIGDPLRLDLPQARVVLNGQALALGGQASADGEKISARREVAGQRLDLAALAHEAKTAKSGGNVSEPAGEQDFGALALFDLDFSLDLDELVLAEGAVFEQVSARSRLQAGRLDLDPLSARLFGGGFEGSARVDFNQQPPEVVLNPRLSGISVKQLASWLAGDSPVDGDGEFEMTMSFRGFTPQQILGSLSGSGAFALAQGVLEGVDLDALISQELTTSNLGNIARSFGGQTGFDNLTGGFAVEDGVVTLPGVDFAAAGYAATGGGVIDLGAGQVDYALELNLGEKLAEQLPRSLRQSTGGRIPLSIAGSIAKPVVSVDVAGLAKGAVRDEVDRRLQSLLEGSQGQEPEDAEAEDGAETGADRKTHRRGAGRDLLRALIGPDEPDDGDESDKNDDQKEEDDDGPPDDPVAAGAS